MSKTMVSNEVYLLPLNDDGSPQVPRQYIYVAPRHNNPVTVRFAIEGASSICRHGSLWVNIPERGSPFWRHKFRRFKLVPDFNQTIEISIPVYEAGVFAFYTTFAELPDLSPTPRKTADTQKTALYYINVAPRLRLKGRHLPLPALSIFSTVSKFMGRYPDDWEPHLRSISDRGYNMVHFTPLQKRGESDSPYSLYDQLGWDPAIFPAGAKDVQEMVDSLEKKHQLLSLTDIVLNHTANNTDWLQDHPEAGYNLLTAPWLESAYLLDTKLLQFGEELEKHGMPRELKSMEDLDRLMQGIKDHVIEPIRLWEYYIVDVDRDADAAVEAWSRRTCSMAEQEVGAWSDEAYARHLYEKGMVGDDRLGERFRRKIDPETGASILAGILGTSGGDAGTGPTKDQARAKMLGLLEKINMICYETWDEDLSEILNQLHGRLEYVRLRKDGPRLGPFDRKNPVVESYFTRLPQNSRTAGLDKRELMLANNGWIWGGDALVDHAGPKSKAYLRRSLIVWGDCAKLRYGTKAEENSWLWDHMAEYSRMLARHFAGLRIDNCHSTPIQVAEHMLDEARRVRPDLYVVAELFTGNEETEEVFVKRLGLNSLIREAMQAHSTAELSRLVHRYGGRPIGSFEVDAPPSPASHVGDTKREVVLRLKPTPVQALFMDCSHDNEPPAQKRDARDTLPNAALVNMCASATGSVMGYDEVFPKLVDLVRETRLYAPPKRLEADQDPSSSSGIGRLKRTLNQIHTLMGKDGYDETHIHHQDQYVTVHRVHPESRKGYFLIAHTAFPGYGDGNGSLSPVHLLGTTVKHLGSWMLHVDTSSEATRQVAGDSQFLRGLPARVLPISGVHVEARPDETVIAVRERFPPGAIALFETSVPAAEHSSGLDTFVTSGARAAMQHLNLVHLNFLLYRCEPEERDAGDGLDGAYDIPGHGRLVYAGLQGWWSILKDIFRHNNLAHPLCENLRRGPWALDHIGGRLERAARNDQARYARLASVATWMAERFDAIRTIPSFLLPRYFGLVVRTAYMAALERGKSLMNDHVRSGQSFLQSLAMVSIQQTGVVHSASLWPHTTVPSLAAGLPHFAVSWARCWGRDVFVSLRGLYLGTGRFEEARQHILAFASVLKHGMIPNLLSSGHMPRYNARDSVWFFLQCIQDYTRIAPGGISLLDAKVKRRFLPYDDTWFPAHDPRAYSKESTMREIIQEAMQRHATGIQFREHNAGPDLDSQMRPEGFDQHIWVDWDANGFVFGGNQSNCGTWMDKMGESERAASTGVPGTPRDGAAVEITGLLYSAVNWLAALHEQKRWLDTGVNKADGSKVAYKDWAALIQANFERCYFVPLTPDQDFRFDVNPAIIHRRGIYKDLYRSGKEYEDYQLRPNFPIAMTVASNLFTPKNALHALCVADEVLRGPTGMRTLDPSDLNYKPYYNNSEDSDSFSTSKGRNYHQGPEWLWPTGFFLRALLKFDLMRRRKDDQDDRTEAFQQVTRRLRACKDMIERSPWAGLAELTNKDGAECADSCPSQAWSAGCIIDLYMDAAEEQKAAQSNSGL